MDFIEDPRIKNARRTLLFAWLFFSLYLTAILLCSYLLGIEPLLFGLPRWVAIGNVIIPVIFVLLLIFFSEKIIPDISLTDTENNEGDIQ